MGADGGTIPKRCELVRSKKKAEKVDTNVQNASTWRTCQLSNQPLKKPVVACRFGRLFNKEAILEGLLDKSLSQSEATKHIKGRSDFKELKLTDNKDYKGDGPARGMVYTDLNDTPWICPITALPMNGVNVFKVNWLCGCVVSEKAMKESKAVQCLACNGPVDADQLVQLYPPEDLLERYKEKQLKEIAAKKAKKVEKKDKISSNDQCASSSSVATITQQDNDSKLIAFKMPSIARTDHSQKTKVSATAAVSELNDRKRKQISTGSIQDDPNVSQAVKNMFTTSDEAKKQKRAHWVTHNPLYF